MNNQLFINTDTSKIFIWNNRTEKFQFNNPAYADVTHPAGTLMGRVSATGRIVPLTAAATDGSQFPIGILYQTTTIGTGETVDLTLCVSGDVVAEKVVLQAGTTLNSVIDGRRLFDRIGADTVGIKMVQGSTELTTYDNPDNAL